MSLIKYKVTELPLEQLSFNSELKEKDKRLIESFSVNENFDSSKHNLGLYIYTPENQLISSFPNYLEYSLSLNAAGAGKTGSEVLTLQPVEDAKKSWEETTKRGAKSYMEPTVETEEKTIIKSKLQIISCLIYRVHARLGVLLTTSNLVFVSISHCLPSPSRS